jgi:Transcriptional accessory protein
VANINRRIAEELGVREQQVEATVALLDGGATVPFVARYRKEITGALDDSQLRTLAERLNYLRELEERRTTVLNSVREQGKLDAALEAAILAADSKGRWKTSTFRSSPSVVPRPRSPERRDWNRWPSCC